MHGCLGESLVRDALFYPVVGHDAFAPFQAEGKAVHAGDFKGESGLEVVFGQLADDVFLCVRHAVAEMEYGFFRATLHEQAVAVHGPCAVVFYGAVGGAGLDGLHVAVSGGEFKCLARQVGVFVFACDLAFHVVASCVQAGGGSHQGCGQ